MEISCEASDANLSLQVPIQPEDHHGCWGVSHWEKISGNDIRSTCSDGKRPALMLKRVIDHRYFDLSLLGLVILAFTMLLGLSIYSA